MICERKQFDPADRFASVDELSDEIFQKVVPFPGGNSTHYAEMKASEPDGLSTGSMLDKLVKSLFQAGATTLAISEDNPKGPPRVILVAIDESHPSAIDNSPKHQEPSKDEVKSSRSPLKTYHGLPEHVEILESQPQFLDDEATMAAIRKILLEEKRERSRLVFPELEPSDRADADTRSGYGDVSDQEFEKKVERRKPFSLAGRMFVNMSSALKGLVARSASCVSLQVHTKHP